jgi:hypothetical protein
MCHLHSDLPIDRPRAASRRAGRAGGRAAGPPPPWRDHPAHRGE